MLCWTVHLNGGPETRNHAFVAVKRKVYSFGAAHDKDQIDVHVFNTVSLSWKKLQPVTSGEERHLKVPSNRQGHSAVLIEDLIYMWGGGYLCCNELYAFDVDTHRWFKPWVSGTVPKVKSYHSACVLEKVMYIHGGRTSMSSQCTNDMYKLDTSTMIWSLIETRGTPPSASTAHSATIIGTKMFIFGGFGSQLDRYNFTRVFDTETNCWLSTTSAQLLPEGRCDHSAFAYNGELYIYGGENRFGGKIQHFNDLWKFNPDTFSWKKVESKGKYPCSRMSSRCSCMVGDRINFGSFDPPNELYILDLSPSLKTLCKLAVIHCGLEQSGLPHNIKWELVGMTASHTGQC